MWRTKSMFSYAIILKKCRCKCKKSAWYDRESIVNNLQGRYDQIWFISTMPRFASDSENFIEAYFVATNVVEIVSYDQRTQNDQVVSCFGCATAIGNHQWIQHSSQNYQRHHKRSSWIQILCIYWKLWRWIDKWQVFIEFNVEYRDWSTEIVSNLEIPNYTIISDGF